MRIESENRFAEVLAYLALLVFLAAWICELLVDIDVVARFQPGQAMSVGIPLAVNLLLVSAVIDGQIATGRLNLSRRDTPLKFWSLIATVFVAFNAIAAWSIL